MPICLQEQLKLVLGVSVTLPELAALMSYFDKEGTGSINCKDFLIMVRVLHPGTALRFLVYVTTWHLFFLFTLTLSCLLACLLSCLLSSLLSALLDPLGPS